MLFIIFFILLLVVFLKFTQPFNKNFASYIQIIAHRGGFHGCAVENSIEAIDKSLKKGIDTFEIDVRYTKDKKIIVFHDDNLKRLAERNECISELNLAELDKIELNQGKFNTRIQALEEYFILQKKHQFRMILDVKPGQDNWRLAKEIYTKLQKHQLLDITCITSFNPIILLYFRLIDQKLTLSMSVERTSESVFARIYYKCLADFVSVKLGLSFLLIQNDLLSTDFIKRKAKQGIQVLAWTINDEADKKFHEKHKRGYLTDKI